MERFIVVTRGLKFGSHVCMDSSPPSCDPYEAACPREVLPCECTPYVNVKFRMAISQSFDSKGRKIQDLFTFPSQEIPTIIPLDYSSLTATPSLSHIIIDDLASLQDVISTKSPNSHHSDRGEPLVDKKCRYCRTSFPASGPVL